MVHCAWINKKIKKEKKEKSGNLQGMTTPISQLYLVVNLEHLKIFNSMVWSGIMPDNPVLMHDTYTQSVWSRLDSRVGVCVYGLQTVVCTRGAGVRAGVVNSGL